jgi:hypothetical protein
MLGFCEDLLFTSKGIKRICSDNRRHPAESTIMGWIKRHPEAREMYIQHKDVQMFWLGEELLEIADGSTVDDDCKVNVERDKLKVETRLKLMHSLNRKSFGTQTDVKLEQMKEQIDELRKIIRARKK